ncbi:MAG: hypothetical protein ACRD45_23150 [Bryobacteraceae bacterium]
MIVDAAKPDATQYSAQYELLRSQVIGTVWGVDQGNTSGVTRGIGLALLLSEGMPGWLKTVESVLRASLARTVDSPDPSPREIVPRRSAAPAWLPAMLRDEVATLLASLVLSTRPLRFPKGECRSW